MSTNGILILVIPVLCIALAGGILVIWATQTLVVQGSKQESWSAFANRIQGVYSPRSLGMPDAVSGLYGNWPVHLDTYVVGSKGVLVDHTRLRAFYAMRVPFEIMLTSPSYEIDQTVARHLAEITNPLANIAIRVMTTNADFAIRFLESPLLRQRLEAVQPIDLQIRRRRLWRGTGLSNSIYEVHIQTPTVVTDVDCLMSMYAVLTACLEQLKTLEYAHQSFDIGAGMATSGSAPLS